MGNIEILYSFTLDVEEKTGKEISKSSRLELSVKSLAENFALSESQHLCVVK